MLIKGGYHLKVSYYDWIKVIWELVDYHVVEEGKEHDEIGIQGVSFNCFDEDE